MLIEKIAARRLRKGTTEDGHQKSGAPIMANRVLALVKKMFNFALDREWIDANPAARLKPPAPETARDRVLSADEIRTLWRELDCEHHRIAALFRVLLLTAQRPGEVMQIRWDQFEPRIVHRSADVLEIADVQNIVWTIPATVTKNKHAHEVPVSTEALKLLRELAEREEQERIKINAAYRLKRAQSLREASGFAFPSRTTDGPILGIQKAVQRLRERCGFAFTAHDLRRTAATLMADAAVPESVIPKLLNHTETDVTHKHYNLHGYRTEKRAALEAWAVYLRNVILAA